MRRVVCVVSLLVVCAVLGLRAQDSEAPETPFLDFSGSATLSNDLYGFASEGTTAVLARRPPSLTRLVVNTNLMLGGTISLPFSMAFSTTETSTITPPLQNQTLVGFLQNAANNFSLSPKVDWAEFHLGSHSPQYSELTVGNVQVFGLGTDLNPGNLRVAASAGLLQRAVEADTARRTRGAYARHIYAGTLGYRAGEGLFAITVARVRDDPASIRTIQSQLITIPDTATPTVGDTTLTRHDLMPAPEEGLVASLSTRIPIAEGMTASAEIAGGLFTKDMNAEAIGERAEQLNSLMFMRTSSRADLAGKVGLDLQYSEWGVGLSAIYVGPGYVTLSYPYLQPDRLEFSASPRFRIIDSAVNVTGTLGFRTNNLAASGGATTQQIIAAVNVDADLAEGLQLTTTYSNFGISTDVTNDTLKVKTVAQAFSIGPVWTISGESATHTIGANFALDNYDDLNPLTGAASSNRTQTILGTYAASLSAIPLSANVTAMTLSNDLPSGTLSIQGLTLGLGYRFLEGKVVPGFSVTYNSSTLGDETPDTQLILRLTAAWSITSKLRLVTTASTTNYSYGSARAGSSFTENLLRTALNWRF